MNARYKELEMEYTFLQKQFQRAVKNKCAKCINDVIKDMTRVDMEQAAILGQPLNSRPGLQLQARG